MKVITLCNNQKNMSLVDNKAQFLNKNKIHHSYEFNTLQSSYQGINFEYTDDDSLNHTTSSIHAQTFVLSLAFFAIWSPQNLMAPNLTQMADYFHFTSGQRDLYLGAYIAFATGVLSLPISGFLGFLSDNIESRKKLYALTVFLGGISSICTGLSTTYTQLYFARLFCGSCMSGCVPIVFSLLGDLFDAKNRNIASSGLTAMMGAGILFGQVYAGSIGDSKGWKHPFLISGICSVITSIMVLKFVREPLRGGKEQVIQDMIARGTKYDRKLTLNGFINAMTKNHTNVLLLLQGFFTNIPWGIIFTFLNDYLSQEQELTIHEATYLLFWFGVGCGAGGILGGYLGGLVTRINRAFLPLFMAIFTFIGIFPFLGLLDLHLSRHHLISKILAFIGGCVINLPSVNVRPCLLNVNPPETRGAAMTTANLIINVSRGIGPSLITMSDIIWGLSRKFSFNTLIIMFWTIASALLLIMINTLPKDQDAMDKELAKYAESELQMKRGEKTLNIINTESSSVIDNINRNIWFTCDNEGNETLDGVESIMSIEERMQSFDVGAAHESLSFIGYAFREIGAELNYLCHINEDHGYEVIHSNDGSDIVFDSYNRRL